MESQLIITLNSQAASVGENGYFPKGEALRKHILKVNEWEKRQKETQLKKNIWRKEFSTDSHAALVKLIA